MIPSTRAAADRQRSDRTHRTYRSHRSYTSYRMPDNPSNDDLQLHIADLDNIVDRERPLLSRVDTGAVDVGAIGAVEVLDGQDVVLKADAGVLARAPDAV